MSEAAWIALAVVAYLVLACTFAHAAADPGGDEEYIDRVERLQERRRASEREQRRELSKRRG